MFCPKCGHEQEYHGQSGCTECKCVLTAADVQNYGHDICVSDRRFVRRDLINRQLHEGNRLFEEISTVVRNVELERFGVSMSIYFSEPKGLMDVFEREDEQGKLDLYAEALSNIEQLEAFITEKDATIVEQRQSLIDKDQEIASLQDRVEVLDTRRQELQKDLQFLRVSE